MISDNQQFRPPSEESRQAGYELSRIRVRDLVVFLGGLTISAVVIHVSVFYFLQDCVQVSRHRERATPVLNNTALGLAPARWVLPPPPRLQPTPGLKSENVPRFDLLEMYEKEDAIFRKLR